MRTFFQSETTKGHIVELIFGAIPFVIMLALAGVEKVGDLAALARTYVFYGDRWIARFIAKVLG